MDSQRTNLPWLYGISKKETTMRIVMNYNDMKPAAIDKVKIIL
jgi:hypothetical protein